MSEQTPSSLGDRRRRAGPGAVRSLHVRDRSLIASAGAAVVARVISALATLVSIGLAARSLSMAELGVVSVLSALLIYFNFGDFGTGSVVMSRLPPAHARGDVAAMRLVVSSALSAMMIVATVLAVIGIASIWLFPWRELLGAESIPWPELRNALLALVITGTVGIVGTVGSRILAALQRGALIRVCDSIAAVATMLAAAFCAAFDAPIWVFLLALFAPLTSTWVLQLGYVMVRYPYMRLGPKDLDVAVGVRFLRDGLSFAVLSMGWAIAYTLDAVVVAAVLGAAQAAVFSIAARLFHIVSGTLTLAGQQMWPAMAEAIARGDVSWVQRRFRHAILTAVGAATLCSVVLVVIGPTVARVWVGEALVPPLSLFLALGVWTIYFTFIVQYSHMLLVAERVRLLAGLGLVLAAVNLAVSIILTQHIGLIGPVVGNLVAAGLIQLVPMIMLTRRFMRDNSLRSTPATS